MYDKFKIQEAYERIKEKENVINEGIFSSLIDDIKRKFRGQVTGKEHIRSIADMFFNVWIGVVKELEDEKIDHQKLVKQIKKDMIDAKRVIDSVLK